MRIINKLIAVMLLIFASGWFMGAHFQHEGERPVVPQCAYEDGSDQPVCVWTDQTTGFTVINFDYGNSHIVVREGEQR